MITKRGGKMQAIWDGRVAYAESLGSRGYSPLTIKQRLHFLDMLGDPATCTRSDVERLISTPTKASSRKVYLSVLRSIFTDLQGMGLVGHDPTIGVRLPRVQRTTPRPLTRHQVDTLLEHPRFRMRAWTMLGCFAGLRASEVTQVAANHLVPTDAGFALVVPHGKGAKEAMVPAHQRIVDLLQGVQPFEGPLWDMRPQSLSGAWSTYAHDAGFPGLRFHQCRHYFGTSVLRSTGNLLVTRDLLRHNSVATTEIYAKMMDDSGFQAVAGL